MVHHTAFPHGSLRGVQADLNYSSKDRGPLIRRGYGFKPHGDGKKARPKSTRNSDGVLIRKDGQPDMRSQVSAAHIRKLHARKTEQKRLGAGSDMSATLLSERIKEIMLQMFPDGIDAARKKLNSGLNCD